MNTTGNKPFKQWVEETGIGEYMPDRKGLMDYRKFMDIVQGVLADPEAMAYLREEYCRGDTMNR